MSSSRSSRGWPRALEAGDSFRIQIAGERFGSTPRSSSGLLIQANSQAGINSWLVSRSRTPLSRTEASVGNPPASASTASPRRIHPTVARSPTDPAPPATSNPATALHSGPSSCAEDRRDEPHHRPLAALAFRPPIPSGASAPDIARASGPDPEGEAARRGTRARAVTSHRRRSRAGPCHRRHLAWEAGGTIFGPDRTSATRPEGLRGPIRSPRSPVDTPGLGGPRRPPYRARKARSGCRYRHVVGTPGPASSDWVFQNCP